MILSGRRIKQKEGRTPRQATAMTTVPEHRKLTTSVCHSGTWAGGSSTVRAVWHRNVVSSRAAQLARIVTQVSQRGFGECTEIGGGDMAGIQREPGAEPSALVMVKDWVLGNGVVAGNLDVFQPVSNC